MLDSYQRTMATTMPKNTYNKTLAAATSEHYAAMATDTTPPHDWSTSLSVTGLRNANSSIAAMIHEQTSTIRPPGALATTLPSLAWPSQRMENNSSSNITGNPLILTSGNTNFSFTLPRLINHATSSPSTTETATATINTTSPLMDEDNNEVLRTIEYIGAILSFYYVPIIVCTGSLGNILSVAVFFKTKLRKLSSSIYLGALAVSDTCFLLGLFAQWLNFVDIHIYNREYFCQFFTYFSNLACFCSNWFVVAFTVERFIAVMYPLKRQTMCTVRRAKMVLLGLTLLGCLHCAPFLISSTPVYSPKAEMTLCDIKTEYKDYITILNYWDTVVVFAIPFTTIAVLNTFTGCTVWKFATVRRTLTMQKIKTQHLPQHHETIVSTPLASSCDTTTASTATATATAAALGLTATVDHIQHQKHNNIPATYRLQATTSVKRHRCDCYTAVAAGAAVHLNGHEMCAAAAAIAVPVPCEVHSHHSHSNRSSMKQHQHQFSSRHRHNFQGNQINHQQQQQRQFSLGATRSCCSGSVCTDTNTRKTAKRKPVNSSQLKVTKMLLIVSTVFVCLNLPSFIMRMITFLETQASTNEKTTIVLQYIFQLFFITNFGINFVLYCVSGQNFRKAFLSIFRRVPTTQRDVTTQITSKYVSEYFCNSGCGQLSTGGIGGGGIGVGSGVGATASSCSSRNVSTRQRVMMTKQNSWNELHEMQNIK